MVILESRGMWRAWCHIFQSRLLADRGMMGDSEEKERLLVIIYFQDVERFNAICCSSRPIFEENVLKLLSLFMKLIR